MPGKFSWNRSSSDKDDKDEEQEERAFGSFDTATNPTVPSNASTYSSSTSASTAISSLFSRAASNVTSASTVDSRPNTKLGNITEQEEPNTQQQQQQQTSQQQQQAAGKKMRIIDFEDLSEIDQLVTDSPPPLVQSSSSRGSSSTNNPQRNFLAALDPYIYNSQEGSGSGGSGGGGVGGGGTASPASRNRTPVFQSSSPNHELQKLADDLGLVLNQTNRVLDVSRAAVQINHLLKNSAQAPILSAIEQGQLTMHNEPAIGRIVKVVLHYVDNLLRASNYHTARMTILQSLYDLGVKLQLVSETMHSVPYPSNFAVGSIPELPTQPMLVTMLEQVAEAKDDTLKEQEGAFIAPILRGVSPEFSALTLSFGFPEPNQDHYSMISALHDVSPDIHIYCQKNFIRACARGGGGSGGEKTRLKPPFRVVDDPMSPPIGVSISASSAVYQSGTLGGYIYPKVKEGHALYEAYGKSTFGITCGHVVLMDSGSSYPEVLVPSSVLISYYRKTLAKECEKYPARSEERATYQREINNLDQKFPVSGTQQTNKPPTSFGQIAWGERKVVNGAMSDLAIIKCAPELTCRNYLGDDVEFSEYDPALMFGNLYVKRIVRKLEAGMNVFKYGSTSKYTSGKINGPRIVYWADGRLQTSEFVVASQESSLFASGGDSGSWVLQKSEDHHQPQGQDENSGPSLGVAGMLHSYDGEKREFGLITTIESILDRLHQVTNVKWGVVGVADDDDDTEDDPAGGSESSSDDDDEGENSDL